MHVRLLSCNIVFDRLDQLIDGAQTVSFRQRLKLAPDLTPYMHFAHIVLEHEDAILLARAIIPQSLTMSTHSAQTQVCNHHDDQREDGDDQSFDSSIPLFFPTTPCGIAKGLQHNL